MFTPLLLASVIAADLPPVPVTVDITRGGSLAWNDVPCRIEARRDGDVIGTSTGSTTSVNVEVTPGPTILIVTCDAAEGAVRRSIRAEVKKAATFKVNLTPGTVVATIDNGGTRTAGQIVVYDDNDVEVQAGVDKAPLLVDAGKKRVVAIVDRGGTRPLRGEKQLAVKSGEKAETVVEIKDGELTVNVTENGRPAKAVIGLRVPGERRPWMELVAGEPTPVPSGTWEITTQLSETHDFREQLTRGVVVGPGQKVSRGISHVTGTVTIDTSPRDGVLVELFRPGETRPFNQLDPGTPARLAPGRYEARATLEGRTLDDGSRPVITQTISVGGTSRVTLTPAVADVEVTVRVGTTGRALPISLAVPAAEKPFVARDADGMGVARFAVAPQKLEVVARLETAHGPIEVKKVVDVRPGTNRVPLVIDRGAVIHQVMDAGAAVAATVRYTLKPKGKAAAGEPLVTLKAGETAWLPPGLYLVEVERLGEKRPFGEVKIVAGQTVEAPFVWSPPPTPAPAAPAPVPTPTPTPPPSKAPPTTPASKPAPAAATTPPVTPPTPPAPKKG